ncbi:YhgE/Pip domain-containing protein [Clostridium lacusfryxellense]|uniref:YhgE/Pip domain-containing protein n=1 Tax=Clostridium lacusfryxellense TaxID=205328 RepID=UPI001C0DF35A|nr:YhgE/Pip domain-containing protein [Clostridium lacusfryxellense]MBU3110534.1 YhgE/Pip domain-containing protein [Clostridium lacusfryxellense]
MNFLKVAQRDILSILKNRFIRVSVIAIIIVPLLYSLLYLAAFWDPYARIKDMPVAVVNQDVGSTKDGAKVNYGKDLVNNLKSKQAVGWKFVTKKQAEDGVKKKDYYAMFVIPENFSENALSATVGKPKQAKILYSANEKRNFLAAQINGKVLDQIKSELTKSMSKEYTTAVFDSLYVIKDGMKKATDGSKQLADGLITAKDGTGQLQVGTKQLNNKVPELSDGVEKLLAGSTTLTSKLGSLKAQMPNMASGVGKLYSGSDQLNKGLLELNKQVPTMATGVQKLNGGANQLNNGLVSLNKQIPTMAEGVQKLNDVYKNQMVPSTGQLKDGASKLALGLGATKEGSSKLGEAATGLKQGSGKLSVGYDQMKGGIGNLKDASASVAGGVDVLLKNNKTSQTDLQQAVEKQLGAYLDANPDAKNDANMQGFLATINSLNKVATDKNNIAMMDELQAGAHGVAEGAKQLEVGSLGFVNGSKEFAQGAEQYSKGAEGFAEKTGSAAGVATQISGGLDKLYTAMNGEFGNGLSQISSKMPSLEQGVAKLATGSGALSDGLVSLNNKIPVLSGGTAKLAVGSGALSEGISGLNQKMPSLVEGTSKLNDGSAQLSLGISTLNGKLPELKNGVNKLYIGANKLDNGILKLADGSKELNEKTKAGYEDLSGSLKNDSKTMADTFSEPVVIDQEPINPVKTYGEGFTPYFIPLSLWVGALMMFFVITDKVDEDIIASPASVVAGKFLSYGAIGFMQAVLASGAVMLLGLRPSNVVLYFLFNILLSFVFIAIIQCLVFLLGQVGRLLSIILLILQLTSCAGTFPIEIVPKLFKVLNPFMPFTYAVSGLREVIAGADYGVLAKDVTVLAIILFVFLITSILMKGHADKAQKFIQERKEQASSTTT